MDNTAKQQLLGSSGIVRGPATLCCYLLLAFFIFMLTIQGNVVPFLKSELDLSYWLIGLHASAIAAGAIVVGVIGDRMVQRFGRKRILFLGALCCAGGALVLCLAPAAWLSIIGCALIGLGGSLIPTVAFAVLNDIHGPLRSVAINETAAINYGLAILAPLLMSVCLSLSLGWRIAVLIGAAFGAAVVLIFRGVALPETQKTLERTGVQLPSVYWAYWCANSFAVAIEFCILLWSAEFLEQVVGMTRPKAAAAAAAFVLAMFIGRIVGVFLARIILVEKLLLVQLAVTLIGFLIYWSGGPPTIAIFGLFILGLGTSILFPLTIGLAMGAAPNEPDVASARVTLAMGLAILVMPVLLGGLADRFGLNHAHLVVPILIAGLLITLVAARTLQHHQTRHAAE